MQRAKVRTCPSAYIALPSMMSNVVKNTSLPGEGTKLGLKPAPADMLSDCKLMTELTDLQFLHQCNGHNNNRCLKGLGFMRARFACIVLTKHYSFLLLPLGFKFIAQYK